MASRYLVPLLAVAVGASAQACGGSIIIKNAADAMAVGSNCGRQTFRGSITISPDVTEPIALDGITGISGSLTANNVTQMNSLGADSLQFIGEDFSLLSLTVLSTLSFPSLVRVNNIMWETLPNLQGLSFSSNGLQEVSTLTIQDTQLGSLDGINLQIADRINIQNNRYLNKVNMQLGNISDSLTLGANGNKLDATFPNMMWANNMTFRNVSTVSIPSLASINGSLGFYSNGFEELSAPNLTRVGSDLSIVSCNAVTSIKMPQLTRIGGGFQIANNTALETINSFPKVQSIGGALDFNGEFSNVQLPALDDVRGAFNLQSTQDIGRACDHFSSIAGENAAIKGTYTCSGKEASPGGAGTLPDGTNSGSGSNSSSSAAHAMVIPGVTSLLGVVAAVFGLL